jgi:hypothetical protein
MHPFTASHLSVVHPIASLQFNAVPATQPVVGFAVLSVGSQRSMPLHTVLSEQSLSCGTLSHCFVPSLQNSRVQRTLSAGQSTGVPPRQ